MNKEDFNEVCRRSEKEICYSAKRAAELFFSSYNLSKTENDYWFHPIALDKSCNHHFLDINQKQQLKTILIECGFKGLIKL